VISAFSGYSFRPDTSSPVWEQSYDFVLCILQSSSFPLHSRAFGLIGADKCYDSGWCLTGHFAAPCSLTACGAACSRSWRGRCNPPTVAMKRPLQCRRSTTEMPSLYCLSCLDALASVSLIEPKWLLQRTMQLALSEWRSHQVLY
jgi:hypothetical protein